MFCHRIHNNCLFPFDFVKIMRLYFKEGMRDESVTPNLRVIDEGGGPLNALKNMDSRLRGNRHESLAHKVT